MHIHAEKAERECKYWLDADAFEIRQAFAYNMSARDTREVRQIISRTLTTSLPSGGGFTAEHA